MAYAQLKTDIAAVIRNNGNQEITGNVLQGALLEMINALGANYQYAGVADTSTTITTTEANVFYLLTEAGTYSNMSSSIVHQNGIGIALWDGTAWSYQNVPSAAVVATDATPTANSTNPVQSGGVVTYVEESIDNKVPYIVISEGTEVYTYHARKILQGHTYRLQKTANYTANKTISFYFRVDKSGTGQSIVNMSTSVNYVDFTADKDYNYIMFYNGTPTSGGTEEIYFYDLAELLRHDIDSFDDDVNFVEKLSAQGVWYAVPTLYLDGWRISSGLWDDNANNSSYIIKVKEGDQITSSYIAQYAWLKSFSQPTHWANAPFVDGTSTISVNGALSVTAPKNAKYMYVANSYNSSAGYSKLRHDNLTINGQIFDKITESKSPSIVVSKYSSVYFDVKIFDDASKEYLTHRFYHMYDERDMTYGDGQTKHLVTCDCWFPSDTLDNDGTNIVQGNVNFIHSIKAVGDMVGEGNYVGEGHGCSLSVYTRFYADGVEFDPMALGNSEMRCDTFRMVEKVNYYASAYVDGGWTFPKLDSNGDMVLTSVHYADALFERNNKITINNRLTIKRDNTIFRSLYAGMCRVYLPEFNKVILNDPDDTANSFSYDGTNWSFVDDGDSGVLLDSVSFLMGDNIVFTGNKYLIQQTIEQINHPWDRLNYRLQIYNDSIKSFKIYQQPVLCSDGETELGKQAETFMDGDVIECRIVRKIDSHS